ncbi:hypothetical protein DMN91_005677 [Ooceraea biroi]|uniref:Transporter n=1 Tax=Ooceraea biroi TaxID=2015173 RepID=A0A3L8DLK1_OOCBI|nr:hypothetical protein DMN91_005677 [Ooceraea biroi]
MGRGFRMGKKTSYTVSDGVINHAFVVGDETINQNGVDISEATHESNARQQWGNDREFLLSCIAMSVGLGNVWRFPFTAYENGGGAFLIPYIFILLIVGKPIYLLEMILGQFSSRSAIKIWDLSPAFRGIGIAQFIIMLALASYYCSLMALTLFYLVASFHSELPWGRCRPEWGDHCVDSLPGNNNDKMNISYVMRNISYSSSAELYFYKEVLHEKDNIDDGIGMPDWRLTIALLVSWLTVFLVVIRGVKSSGKAAYFLAIFPYVVLIVLLVRAVTLNGSVNGILYFITPTWQQLLTPMIWYHAVAQCFFSLTVCFGAVVMFASHNKFHHNVYRDATIVTTLDTFTSLLAGCTIFAILGNLSHELAIEDIGAVVRGGTGLAFISYPEMIAKFTVAPQFFGVVFFAMLFVLGIGSAVGLASAAICIIRDQFPQIRYWHVAAGTCFCEFLIGLIYVTPGGQFMVTFVDYYVTSFIAFLPATFELIAVAWSYAIGWVIFAVAVLQIPLWILFAIFKKKHLPFREMIKQAFQPSKSWGPSDIEDRAKWLAFRDQCDAKEKNNNRSANRGWFQVVELIIVWFSPPYESLSLLPRYPTVHLDDRLVIVPVAIHSILSPNIVGRDEKQLGLDNVAFQLDEPRIIKNDRGAYYPDRDSNSILDVQIAESEKKRATWNNSVEFLMSCIAVSVGFGNIWRFPFTAYENGGGAFLIPYVILLFLVGKPFYFLEMIIGQFSSKSFLALIGVGWAQFCSTIALATYYSSLMALTLYYLIASFSAELPWATCLKEWGDTCVDSSTKRNHNVDLITAEENVDVLNNLLNSSTQVQSSAELYFSRVVLHEKENIDDGIGLPSWQLTLCLFGSWAAICAVLFQGVKSSGRFSYFLAIFPYIVLVSLLIRAVTLDGAIDGILYFITPKWSKLLEPTVWYAAVTQCFFSLSVCFGSIITYSSHNDFKHNIYRDVLIITSLDTVTSLLAGCTIFGILGNLAYELGVDDISKVVRGGAGLAFVSYPDAIAKFSFLPQLFAVLFFVMMFVLGVGSAVGMVTGIITVINEQFPKLKTWQIVVPACCLGFAIGTVYVTPGGQFILTLVDYYGASFVVFILASFEMTGVIWVYVATLSPVTYGQRSLPASAHAAGWTLLCIGVLQIPLWMLIAMLKKRELPCMQMVKAAFAPVDGWGPQEVQQRKNWKIFKEERARAREKRIQPIWQQMLYVLLNKEPK